MYYDYQKFSGKIIRFFHCSEIWRVKATEHAQGNTELPAVSPAKRGILKTDLESLETELQLSRWAVVSHY